MWSALKEQKGLREVLNLLLTGVSIQVLLSLVYRSSMWYLYVGELGNLDKTTYRYKVSDWISDQHWPEILADLITLLVFGKATLQMLGVVCV